MKWTIVVGLLVVAALQSECRAQSDCTPDLVKSTYNSISSDHVDVRLASFVSEGEYNEIKHNGGLNVVIYGVPVGASYADFQKQIRQKTSSSSQSLTHDQALNVMWTGLDANATTAY